MSAASLASFVIGKLTSPDAISEASDMTDRREASPTPRLTTVWRARSIPYDIPDENQRFRSEGSLLRILRARSMPQLGLPGSIQQGRPPTSPRSESQSPVRHASSRGASMQSSGHVSDASESTVPSLATPPPTPRSPSPSGPRRSRSRSDGHLWQERRREVRQDTDVKAVALPSVKNLRGKFESKDSSPQGDQQPVRSGQPDDVFENDPKTEGVPDRRWVTRHNSLLRREPKSPERQQTPKPPVTAASVTKRLQQIGDSPQDQDEAMEVFLMTDHQDLRDKSRSEASLRIMASQTQEPRLRTNVTARQRRKNHRRSKSEPDPSSVLRFHAQSSPPSVRKLKMLFEKDAVPDSRHEPPPPSPRKTQRERTPDLPQAITVSRKTIQEATVEETAEAEVVHLVVSEPTVPTKTVAQEKVDPVLYGTPSVRSLRWRFEIGDSDQPSTSTGEAPSRPSRAVVNTLKTPFEKPLPRQARSVSPDKQIRTSLTGTPSASVKNLLKQFEALSPVESLRDASGSKAVDEGSRRSPLRDTSKKQQAQSLDSAKAQAQHDAGAQDQITSNAEKDSKRRLSRQSRVSGSSSSSSSSSSSDDEETKDNKQRERERERRRKEEENEKERQRIEQEQRTLEQQRKEKEEKERKAREEKERKEKEEKERKEREEKARKEREEKERKEREEKARKEREEKEKKAREEKERKEREEKARKEREEKERKEREEKERKESEEKARKEREEKERKEREEKARKEREEKEKKAREEKERKEREEKARKEREEKKRKESESSSSSSSDDEERKREQERKRKEEEKAKERERIEQQQRALEQQRKEKERKEKEEKERKEKEEKARKEREEKERKEREEKERKEKEEKARREREEKERKEREEKERKEREEKARKEREEKERKEREEKLRKEREEKERKEREERERKEREEKLRKEKEEKERKEREEKLRKEKEEKERKEKEEREKKEREEKARKEREEKERKEREEKLRKEKEEKERKEREEKLRKEKEEKERKEREEKARKEKEKKRKESESSSSSSSDEEETKREQERKRKEEEKAKEREKIEQQQWALEQQRREKERKEREEKERKEREERERKEREEKEKKEREERERKEREEKEKKEKEKAEEEKRRREKVEQERRAREEAERKEEEERRRRQREKEEAERLQRAKLEADQRREQEKRKEAEKKRREELVRRLSSETPKEVILETRKKEKSESQSSDSDSSDDDKGSREGKVKRQVQAMMGRLTQQGRREATSPPREAVAPSDQTVERLIGQFTNLKDADLEGESRQSKGDGDEDERRSSDVSALVKKFRKMNERRRSSSSSSSSDSDGGKPSEKSKKEAPQKPRKEEAPIPTIPTRASVPGKVRTLRADELRFFEASSGDGGTGAFMRTQSLRGKKSEPFSKPRFGSLRGSKSRVAVLSTSSTTNAALPKNCRRLNTDEMRFFSGEVTNIYRSSSSRGRGGKTTRREGRPPAAPQGNSIPDHEEFFRLAGRGRPAPEANGHPAPSEDDSDSEPSVLRGDEEQTDSEGEIYEMDITLRSDTDADDPSDTEQLDTDHPMSLLLHSIQDKLLQPVDAAGAADEDKRCYVVFSPGSYLTSSDEEDDHLAPKYPLVSSPLTENVPIPTFTENRGPPVVLLDKAPHPAGVLSDASTTDKQAAEDTVKHNMSESNTKQQLASKKTDSERIIKASSQTAVFCITENGTFIDYGETEGTARPVESVGVKELKTCTQMGNDTNLRPSLTRGKGVAETDSSDEEKKRKGGKNEHKEDINTSVTKDDIKVTADSKEITMTKEMKEEKEFVGERNDEKGETTVLNYKEVSLTKEAAIMSREIKAMQIQITETVNEKKVSVLTMETEKLQDRKEEKMQEIKYEKHQKAEEKEKEKENAEMPHKKEKMGAEKEEVEQRKEAVVAKELNIEKTKEYYPRIDPDEAVDPVALAAFMHELDQLNSKPDASKPPQTHESPKTSTKREYYPRIDTDEKVDPFALGAFMDELDEMNSQPPTLMPQLPTEDPATSMIANDSSGEEYGDKDSSSEDSSSEEEIVEELLVAKKAANVQESNIGNYQRIDPDEEVDPIAVAAFLDELEELNNLQPPNYPPPPPPESSKTREYHPRIDPDEKVDPIALGAFMDELEKLNSQQHTIKPPSPRENKTSMNGDVSIGEEGGLSIEELKTIEEQVIPLASFQALSASPKSPPSTRKDTGSHLKDSNTPQAVTGDLVSPMPPSGVIREKDKMEIKEGKASSPLLIHSMRQEEEKTVQESKQQTLASPPLPESLERNKTAKGTGSETTVQRGETPQREEKALSSPQEQEKCDIISGREFIKFCIFSVWFSAIIYFANDFLS